MLTLSRGVGCQAEKRLCLGRPFHRARRYIPVPGSQAPAVQGQTQPRVTVAQSRLTEPRILRRPFRLPPRLPLGVAEGADAHSDQNEGGQRNLAAMVCDEKRVRGQEKKVAGDEGREQKRGQPTAPAADPRTDEDSGEKSNEGHTATHNWVKQHPEQGRGEDTADRDGVGVDGRSAIVRAGCRVSRQVSIPGVILAH